MKTKIKQITAATCIAFLLLVGNAKATELKTTSLEATETNLQLENWMFNETIWTATSFDFIQVSESNLELEDWMTNDNTWNLNFVEETEAELQIEDWMIKDEFSYTEVIEVEPALTVKPWMLETNIL